MATNSLASLDDTQARLLREHLADGQVEHPVMHSPGLSDDQREAIEAARELGLYTVPRSVTMQDVGDDLGVSHQAISERLRRAHGRLVDALFDSPEQSMEVGQMGLEERGGELRVYAGRVFVGTITPAELVNSVSESEFPAEVINDG